MTTLKDVQNLPKRQYRTVNDLSISLIQVVGLPRRYQLRIERAERMIHLCNPIVRAYYSISRTHHNVSHDGPYQKCEHPTCIESKRLVSAWGVDRKAMQSGKSRSEAQVERRARERVKRDGRRSAMRTPVEAK